MNATNFALFSLVFLTIYTTSSAIKCYDCDGELGSDCEVSVMKAQTKECPFDWICSKFVVSKSDGKGILNRKCEKKDICSMMEKKYNDPEKKTQVTECFTCDKDLCNSSSIIIPSFLTILVLAIMFVN